jgi:phosphatidylglycerol lysyltransferase
MKKWLHQLGPLLVVLIFILAAWLLYRELRHYKVSEIREALTQIPSWRIWAALGLTVVNYLVLIGYDYLAIRAIGHPLSLARVALASFTGFVTSYNFGALLGGTSVRYRLYSAWGLSAVEIVQLVVMMGITFWVGIFALAGVFFVLQPFPIPADLHLPVSDVRPLGWALLAVSVGYVAITYIYHAPIRIKETQIQLPRTGMTVLQLIVAAADLTVAAACLFILVSHDLAVGFGEFLGMYLLAVVAVIITHVPGGLGVFELVLLTLASTADANPDKAAGTSNASATVVAALLIFRVIYYLLPLLIALLLLAGNEVALRRGTTTRVRAEIGSWSGTVAAAVMAWATFVAGAVLLLSGASRAAPARLEILERVLPLSIIEGSHFLGSLAGAALLVLSRGLQRRLDSAWWLSVGLLVVGIAASLLKGLDYEEAILLTFILISLIFCRKSFYRKGSLIHEPFTAGWIAAVSLAVVCSVWLGLFAHKHVEYSSPSWWTFEFYSDAPRFLRATVGAASLLLLFALGKLLSAEKPRPAEPSADEMAAALSIIHKSSRTSAHLALLGDKSFRFNKAHTAFVMYAVHDRAWVALGDPVGPEAEAAELVWQFRELVDQYEGWPIFYQVAEETLSVYLDQGMTLLKIGDEGRVSLKSFALERIPGADVREAHRQCQQAGYQFAIVPAAEVPPLLPRFREISTAWLGAKQTHESGFSLAFFEESYLLRFPAAVVRRDGEIVAFANLWCAANHAELAIDLLRYMAAVPEEILAYVFIEVMLWGKQQGYQWFNLGMAPLSGGEERPLAPLWNRTVNLDYRHGDHFSSFEALREFKEKFSPVWSARYLASPGGLALPRILTAVTALVADKHHVGTNEM